MSANYARNMHRDRNRTIARCLTYFAKIDSLKEHAQLSAEALRPKQFFARTIVETYCSHFNNLR